MNSTNEYRNMKNHFCLNLFFLLYLFFCAGCKQHISDSAAKANEALFTAEFNLQMQQNSD